MTLQIQIDNELKALIPPLKKEEFEQLEANIVLDGCRDPLVVWNDILIDGHNRHAICTKHNISFNVNPISFESKAHARIWMRNNQKGRRNLPEAWLIELELGNKEDLAEIGRAKYKETVGRPSKEIVIKNDNDLSTPEPKQVKHNTQKKIAESAGVSTGQVAQAEIVRRDAPDLWEKAKTQEITIGAAYKQVKKKKKQEALQEAIKEQAKTGDAGQPTIEVCDAIEWLSRQDPADLLITDPPYSTDVDDIEAFARSWLPLALSKVKPTGRAYVFIGAYPQELAAYLSVAMPDQVLVWTYRNTLGPSPSHNYKLNWQAILYYKGVDAPPLNSPQMIEQFSVQDISAPDGRQGDRYHAWQKPMDIADRFIRHATKVGDTVIDPFACTGTFLVSASILGRIAKGCDISEEHALIAQDRGCRILSQI